MKSSRAGAQLRNDFSHVIRLDGVRIAELYTIRFLDINYKPNEISEPLSFHSYRFLAW